METYAALLRGINLAGRNTVPMKALAALFADAGCIDVLTYIASGNVVFKATPALAERLSSLVTKAIAHRFRCEVPVVLRTARELTEILRSNPFLATGADPDELHVAFLGARPSAKSVASLDHSHSPLDEFVVRRREIYLRLPSGVGRSKLTNAYFEAKLATSSTLRNWRTVGRLVELARNSAGVMANQR